MDGAIRQKPFASIDGFRFLAALWVFTYHFAPESWRASPLARAAIEGGQITVSALFVLSGFVLAHGRSLPMDREGRARFWVGRFARLYPVHLLGFLLALPFFIHALARRPDMAVDWRDTLAYLTLTSAWMPRRVFSMHPAGWALSAVAFFSLVFPFAIRALARRSPRGMLGIGCAAWLAGLAAPSLLVALGVPDVDGSIWARVVRYDPLLRTAEFLSGVALGSWWARTRVAPPVWVHPLALAGWIGLSAAPIPRGLLHNGLLTPLVALSIVCMSTGRGPLARALGWRPIALLGRAGFGMFVLQFPLRWIVLSAFLLLGWPVGRTTPAFAVSLVVTLAVASGSLMLLERPAQARIVAAWAARKGRGSTLFES